MRDSAVHTHTNATHYYTAPQPGSPPLVIVSKRYQGPAISCGFQHKAHGPEFSTRGVRAEPGKKLVPNVPVHCHDLLILQDILLKLI